jgi:II/X family phage/plasmid replication protein
MVLFALLFYFFPIFFNIIVCFIILYVVNLQLTFTDFLGIFFMIDWLSMKIPCCHSPIPCSRVLAIKPCGEIEYESSKFRSFSGSFDSKISLKSTDLNEFGEAQTLLFSGNLAKFCQGHNVFGTDDVYKLLRVGLSRLFYILDTFHDIDLLPAVDLSDHGLSQIVIDRIDINYMYSLRNKSDVYAWLKAAEYNSHTRHGRPRNDKGTVYWGKNSRRWSLKAYYKYDEICFHDSRIFDVAPYHRIKSYIHNMLRIELTLRQLELRKLDIITVKHLPPVVRLYTDYIGRLDMSSPVTLPDSKVFDLPPKLAATYQLWVSGYNLFQMLPKTTFYRHRKELLNDFNIDISNVPPSVSNNVIPLIRPLEAEPVSIPDFVQHLKLVI